MKKLCTLLSIAALVLAGGLATKDALAAAAPQDVEAEDEHTPLASSMEQIEDALRSLRKSLRNAEQNPASLESIVTLQRAVSVCKVETPVMAANLPAEERGDFVRDYRKGMISMTRQLLDLEELVLDGKQEEAKDLLKEIRDLEDSGHERFTEDG